MIILYFISGDTVKIKSPEHPRTIMEERGEFVLVKEVIGKSFEGPILQDLWVQKSCIERIRVSHG